MGAYFHVELHVTVDDTIPVGRAHVISEKVQQEIAEAMPEVCCATVHIEPHRWYLKQKSRKKAPG